MHTNIRVALKCIFMSSLYAFSSTTFKILNLQKKKPKIFAFYLFVLKCCLHRSMYAILMLSKTTYPQKLIPSDCIILHSGPDLAVLVLADGQTLEVGEGLVLRLDQLLLLHAPLKVRNHFLKYTSKLMLKTKNYKAHPSLGYRTSMCAQ